MACDLVEHRDVDVAEELAAMLREDLPFRQEWAERVGLGFSLNAPEAGLPWATKRVATAIPAAA